MKKISLLVLAMITTGSLLAQNWTGAVNSDWNNPANWSATPGNGNDITIDPANYTGAMSHPSLTGVSSFTPAEMLIQNGAQFTVSGTLSASDRVEVVGAGTVVTVNGAFALNGGGNNARLIFVDGAHLQMEAGTLQVGQRLLFELGASGEVNGGSVVVGETIALVDGNVNASSKLVQNGGTITTNGEFGFENEAGAFYPSFVQTGGELHVNGSLVWLGVAPGAGRGYVRSAGGAIFVTGTIGNDPASTMGMQIELSGNNTLLQNTGTSVATLAGDSILLADGAQWSDITTVSWQNKGVFHASGGAYFMAGNTTLNGTGSYQFDHVNIAAGKQLVHVSPAHISVSGNLVAMGTFNHNSNLLVLNGTAQQEVTANFDGLSLYDLNVDNTANGTMAGTYGITLNSNLNIAHSLYLTDGIIESGLMAVVKLADNATVTGGSDTTFVTGYMEKTGNQAIEFPVGSGPGRYRPLAISAPVSATTKVRVAYVFNPYTNLTPVEAPLQSVSSIEYWDLSRTGATDLFTASVGWNNAAESGLMNCGDISMSVWNGTEWTFVASTTTGLCDGNNSGTLQSSVQLPVVGPLAIGFTSNVTQHPVQLCAGESITVGLNTYTASGIYIDVLEDTNGDDSTVVTILTVLDPLAPAITNNVTQLVANVQGAASYQWIDCGNGNAVIAGETSAEFYPAVNGSYAFIASANGCSDTSACVTVASLGLAEETFEDVSLYPNPVESAGKLMVSAGMSHLGIATLDGRVIQPVSMDETAETVVVRLPALVPGTYLLTGETREGNVLVKRFVVR